MESGSERGNALPTPPPPSSLPPPLHLPPAQAEAAALAAEAAAAAELAKLEGLDPAQQVVRASVAAASAAADDAVEEEDPYARHLRSAALSVAAIFGCLVFGASFFVLTGEFDGGERVSQSYLPEI